MSSNRAEVALEVDAAVVAKNSRTAGQPDSTHQQQPEQGLAQPQRPAKCEETQLQLQGNSASESPTPTDRKAFAKKWAQWLWDLACEHWFLLGMGFAIGFAAAVPDFGRTGGWIQSQWTIKYGAVIVIFLLSGMGLKTRVLATALSRLPVHALIQVISLGITPLIGFGVGAGLLTTPTIDPSLSQGIIICASMPTTVSTNVVFTRDAGGNEAVALINAVLGNIIGVFISPALLQVYLSSTPSVTAGPSASPPHPPPLALPPPSTTSPNLFPYPPPAPSPPASLSGVGGSTYASVLQTLALTVILPLAVGQLVLAFGEKYVKLLQKHVNFGKVSNTCVLLIIWSTFCTSFYNKVTSSAASIVVIVVIQVVLYVAFFILCLGLSRFPPVMKWMELDRSDAVAIAMCGATKTIALGMPIITTMFSGQPNAGLLSLPLLIYHASQILLGSASLRPLKTWVEKEREKFPVLPLVDGPPGGAGGGAGDAGGAGGAGGARGGSGVGSEHGGSSGAAAAAAGGAPAPLSPAAGSASILRSAACAVGGAGAAASVGVASESSGFAAPPAGIAAAEGSGGVGGARAGLSRAAGASARHTSPVLAVEQQSLPLPLAALASEIGLDLAPSVLGLTGTAPALGPSLAPTPGVSSRNNPRL